MKRDFTLKEKIGYYEKRASDKTLTREQRAYACDFLDGVEQAKYGKNPKYTPTTADQRRKVEVAEENLKMNKRYGGDTAYWGGVLAFEKEELSKRQSFKPDIKIWDEMSDGLNQVKEILKGKSYDNLNGREKNDLLDALKKVYSAADRGVKK